MTFILPDLPYSKDALTPVISVETVDYHYGKHHKKYVDTLNKLVEGTPWQGKSLEEIIKQADGGIFNNAAQVWNHTFYWSCLDPQGGKRPEGELARAIDSSFGGLERLKQEFTRAATTRFGSGWAWLVQEPGGKLAVTDTLNADNPLRQDHRPLLTCDVWEHAYYIDYRNARPDYVEAFWGRINWDHVASVLRS